MEGSTQLILIRVGKCGGATVTSALLAARMRFQSVHITRARELPGARYVILLRDPIQRAFSAFNWRWRLVVEEGSQRWRFPGEYDILTRYGTLGSLAERLCGANGVPDAEVVAEFRTIHHLRESIAFYFTDFDIAKLAPQIKYVMFQESLAEDFKKAFGCSVPLGSEHCNGRAPAVLSQLARQNLRVVLHDDYECIEQLHRAGLISEKRYSAIFGAQANVRT
jgi:hypothetical protein